MKILFVSPLCLEPADTGVKTHLRWIIEGLTRRHEVTLIGFHQTEPEKAAWPRVAKTLGVRFLGSRPLATGLDLTIARLRALVRGKPPGLAHYHHRAYVDLLAEGLAGQPDWVILGQYFAADIPAAPAGTRTLLLPVDSYHLYYERLAQRTGSRWLAWRSAYLAWAFGRMESEWRRKFEWIAPVAAPDAARIEEKSGAARVAVLPVASAAAGSIRARTGHRVAVVGAFGMRIAEEGAFELLDGERPLGASAELVVWGRGASARLRKATRAAGGDYVAWVADYQAFLDTFDVLLYPQRAAAGIQTKVQQAMALGIPVVAHPEVLSGIGARPGREALAACSPKEFRQAARDLLNDQCLRQRLGREAHRLIAERFHPEVIWAGLERILLSPRPPKCV